METRQNVYYNMIFLSPMERGMIPEENLWAVVRGKRSHIWKCGWRYTMQSIVERKVPYVTWSTLKKAFNLNRIGIIEEDEMPEIVLTDWNIKVAI